MLLAVTVLLMLFLLVSAVTSPQAFVVAALWTLSVPYWWNFNLQTIFSTPIGQLNILAIQVFGLCLAGLLFVATSGGIARAMSGRYLLHSAFLLICVMSLSYAPSMAFGTRMLAKLLAPFLFLLAVEAAVTSEQQIIATRRAIVGNGLLIACLAVLARLLGINADPNAVLTGSSGLGPPGMGPPVFSAHMLPVAMVAMAYLVATGKKAYALLLILCVLAIVAARQRTSAAALYLGCAAIMAVGTRGIWRLVLPVAGVLAIPALFILNDDFRRRMFYGNSDAGQLIADPATALSRINGSGRFALWDEVLARFFKPHPLQGSGIGSTQEFLYANQSGVGVVHSEYVRLLCEVGVLGLVAFGIAAIGYLVWLGARAHRAESPEAKAISLSALGSIVAYLVFMSTDNAFDYVGQLGIYVFALVALASCTSRIGLELRLPAQTAPKAPRQLANLMS